MKPPSPAMIFVDLNDPRFREIGRGIMYRKMAELCRGTEQDHVIFQLIDVATKAQRELTPADVMQILETRQEPVYSALLQVFVEANRDAFEDRAEEALHYINQVAQILSISFASLLQNSLKKAEHNGLTLNLQRESKLKKTFHNNGNA